MISIKSDLLRDFCLVVEKSVKSAKYIYISNSDNIFSVYAEGDISHAVLRIIQESNTPDFIVGVESSKFISVSKFNKQVIFSYKSNKEIRGRSY